MTGVVGSRRRGQPLIVLGFVLFVWTVGRLALWQNPFPFAESLPSFTRSQPEANEAQPWRMASSGAATVLPAGLDTSHAGTEQLANHLVVLPQPSAAAPRMVASPRAEVFAGHQFMWLAAMSHVPVPSEVAALIRKANSSATLPAAGFQDKPESDLRTGRWAFDAWVLFRPDAVPSGAAGLGPRPASYGTSQAGGVIAFFLDPDSRHKPSAFFRFTHALSASRESEAAIGLAARPIEGLPMRMQAEMRAQRVAGRTNWRPAIAAVTEVPRVDLPLGARADIYAQAGYVGGEFATPFADGQLRISREIADFDLGKVDAGAGVWGGAQRGAARLDVGPTAGLDVRIGDVPARLSVDYRQRIAGDAVPQSGIAVTLSTSF